MDQSRKKIKIAVITDQLLPGGVQKAAIEEVKNLNELGYESKLLIQMRKGFEGKYGYLLKGVPHEFLSDRYPKIFRKSFKFPVFKFFSTLHLVSPILAPLNVKKKEFDLIISHGTTTSITTWTIWHFKKIPYIAVIHDPMIYILEKVYSETSLKYFFPLIKPISTALEKRFVAASKVCLVDSKVHASFLENTYKIKPQVLSLGVNAPRKIPQKRGNKIISFGRWDLEKNPQLLLDLLGEIENFDLIIAGIWTNKSDLKKFQQLIIKKELKNRVRLITSYKDYELSSICKLGRVWIHPHFEAFSLSALEASSHGLPIVIPKRSGITELFKDGEEGYFPENLNVMRLKEIIKPLLKNPKLAFEMGKKGAEIVRLNYTPQARAKKISFLISTILKSKEIKLVALETGHIGASGLAGGDRLLEQMAKRLKVLVKINVIIAKSNSSHWQKSGVNVKLIELKRNFFDRFIDPFAIFLTYLIRIIQSTWALTKFPPESILYSSTGILPDVAPSYICKVFFPDFFWIARIHHLSPSPKSRPGDYWVNLGSYILQWISLKLIMQKADLVLVLNQKLKTELCKKGYLEKKITVLGGGIDFEAIQNFSPKKTKSYDGVFLGRIHPAKGVFDLPLIWQEVLRSKSNAKLGIIGPFGTQEIRQKLLLEFKNLGIDKQVDLLGFVSQNEVWSLLKNSKVFLFTDHEAGWGLAVGEAMAAKLPVIGWDIGVLGTVFKKGYLVVPKNDYQKYAQEILSLLKNESSLKKISKQALDEAKKLDWAVASEKFDGILQNLS